MVAVGRHRSVQSGVVVGSIEGGIGVIAPVEEKVYRRLALLQVSKTCTEDLVLYRNRMCVSFTAYSYDGAGTYVRIESTVRAHQII
jgi:hypothetical protein